MENGSWIVFCDDGVRCLLTICRRCLNRRCQVFSELCAFDFSPRAEEVLVCANAWYLLNLIKCVQFLERSIVGEDVQYAVCVRAEAHIPELGPVVLKTYSAIDARGSQALFRIRDSDVTNGLRFSDNSFLTFDPWIEP